MFIYVGALDSLVRTVAGILAGNGLFAFSVETLIGSDGFALQLSRRYAHSEIYVRRVLATNGFSILSLDSTTIRHDRREPVEGLAVTAEKQPPML